MPLERAELGYFDSSDPGEPTTSKPRLSITDNEAEILAALGAGKAVLEIGTGLGVSTRALARHSYVVDTIDPDPWVAEAVVPNLVAECPNVRAFSEREGHEFYDLAFIDGSHVTADVLADIEFVEKHTLSFSMIVCHDARYPNVRAALTGDDWHFIETDHVLAYRWSR